MPAMPHGEQEPLEGDNDDYPIELPGDRTSKKDFENFLYSMYPDRLLKQDPYKSMEKNDWISALRLATMWGFHGPRTLAIRELTTRNMLGPIDKVELALGYGVSDWLQTGVLELAGLQTLKISSEDASRLGTEVLRKIYTVRECAISRLPAYISGKYVTQSGHPRTYLKQSSQTSECKQKVLTVFADELRDME